MKTNKQKIVIVGGGFAGIKTALDLSHHKEFDITLISENDNFRYYPSLYHTATGGSRESSTIPLSDILNPKRVKTVKAEVVDLDRAQKFVRTKSGKEYPYDYLVLALGVVTNFFNIPGLQEYAYGIKSLEDAEKLKAHLHRQIMDDRKPDLNYVIVGGGPTGVELAGVLGDYIRYICHQHDIKPREVHVDLVEAAPRLLARLPADLSKRVAKQLKRKGVKLYLKSAVQAETADNLTVNGKPIRSHTVIWTAGMANHPFFSQHGFQLSSNHKVRVDQFLQAEPSIFVAGDNADTPFSGMAQTALYDGSYIARSLVEIVKLKKTPRPYRAKQPVYVMPAGPDWAAVLWGRFKIYGRIGWVLRRVADLVGYHDYEPVFKATKQWLTEYEREDTCSVCDKNRDLLPIND